MSYCVARNIAAGTLELTSALTPENGVVLGRDASLRYASLSPNGQYLAVPTTVPPYIFVLRTADCSQVGLPDQLPVYDGPAGARWIGNDYLLIEYSARSWNLYRTSDWAVAYSDTLTNRVGSVVSPQNTHVVSAHSASPRLRLLDVAAGTLYNLTSETAASVSREFSPNGQFFYVYYTSSPWVRIYNTAARTFTALDNARVENVKFSPDSNYVSLLRYASPYLWTVYRTSNWSAVGSINLVANNGNYCEFSYDGAFAIGVTPTGIDVRRTSDWSQVTFAAGYRDFNEFPDRNRIVAFSSTLPTAVIDLETGVLTPLPNTINRYSVVFYPLSAQFHLTTVNTQEEPVYSSVTLEQVATLRLGGFSFNETQISPNESAVVYCANLDWRAFALPDWTPITPRMTSASSFAARFTPDGALLFCLDSGGEGLSRSHLYRQTEAGWAPVYENRPAGRASHYYGLSPLFGEAFTVSGQVFGTDGNPSMERVIMLPVGRADLMQTAQTNASGRFTLTAFNETNHLALIDDQREKVWKINPTVFAVSRAAPPQDLVLRLSNAGDLYPIGSNATKASGGAVDSVVVFEWSTSEPAAKVVPALNGDWTATVHVGEYGLLYLAKGCAPVTHGPYTVSAD